MASRFDVVVVGAGAAGLAAVRSLRAAGLAVIALEARDRTGGRCHTDLSLGMPFDAGAHWLHDAERNPLRAHADRLGVRYGRAARRLVIHGAGGYAGAARLAEVQAYFERAFRAVAAAGERGEDRPASEVVPPHPRLRAMFESFFAALNGVEPERMSTLDYARSIDGANWPVLDGYGTLLKHLADGLPVELMTPVRRIRWDRRRVRVGTDRGTIEAAAVLVTLPTNVLASGGITFEPALPATVEEAWHALPLGEANKVAFAFDRNVFGREEHHLLGFEHDTLETTRFDVRPAGRNLAIAYFGGSFARTIEEAGEAPMRDFALSRLIEAYGTLVARHVTGSVCTGWCRDGYALGGYSCARPGRAEARRVLAEPVGERVFFAGEAASIDAYGTVHGAWRSGERAAARIIEWAGAAAAGTKRERRRL